MLRKKRNNKSVERFIGQQMIFFCAGIQHAEDIAELFNKLVPLDHPAIVAARERYVENQRRKYIAENKFADFNEAEVRKRFTISAAVHSGLSEKEKQRRLQAINEAGILIPTGEKIFITGLNHKELTFGLRIPPTGSNTVSKQGGGRLTRLNPNNPYKVAVLIEVDWGLSGPVKQIFYSKWLDNKRKCGLRHDSLTDDSQLPKVIIPEAEYLSLNPPLQWDPATDFSIVNKKRKSSQATTEVTASSSSKSKREVIDFVVDFDTEYRNMVETVEQFKQYFTNAPNMTVNSISFTPVNEAQDDVSAVTPKKMTPATNKKQKLISDTSDSLDSVDQQALHSLIDHIEKINTELNSIFGAIIIDTDGDEQLIEMNTANNNALSLLSTSRQSKSKLERKFEKVTDAFYCYLAKMKTITQRMGGHNQSESGFQNINNKNFENRNENIKDSLARLLQDMKQTRAVIASREFYDIIQQRKREKEEREEAKRQQEEVKRQQEQQMELLSQLESFDEAGEHDDLVKEIEEKLLAEMDVDSTEITHEHHEHHERHDEYLEDVEINAGNPTLAASPLVKDTPTEALLPILLEVYAAIRQKYYGSSKLYSSMNNNQIFSSDIIQLFNTVMPSAEINDETKLIKYSTLSFRDFVYALDNNRTNPKLSELTLTQGLLQLGGYSIAMKNLSYVDFTGCQLTNVTFTANKLKQVTGLTPDNTNYTQFLMCTHCQAVIDAFEKYYLTQENEDISSKKSALFNHLFNKPLMDLYRSHIISINSDKETADYQFNYMIAYIILSIPNEPNNYNINVSFSISKSYELLIFFLQNTNQAKSSSLNRADFYFLINLFLGLLEKYEYKISNYLKEENYNFLNKNLLENYVDAIANVINNNKYTMLIDLFEQDLQKYFTEAAINNIENMDILISYMMMTDDFSMLEYDYSADKVKYADELLASIQPSHTSLLPGFIRSLTNLQQVMINKNLENISKDIEKFISILGTKEFELSLIQEYESNNEGLFTVVDEAKIILPSPITLPPPIVMPPPIITPPAFTALPITVQIKQLETQVLSQDFLHTNDLGEEQLIQLYLKRTKELIEDKNFHKGYYATINRFVILFYLLLKKVFHVKMKEIHLYIKNGIKNWFSYFSMG